MGRSDRPLFSVAIPTYNRSQYLKRCLDSVLGQELDGEFEVVVSDNASPDDTRQLVDDYRRRDPRVKYFRNERNLGMTGNVYEATRRAQGQYILWLADDDWLNARALARMAEIVQKRPELGYVSSHLITVDDKTGAMLTVRTDFTTERYFCPGLETFESFGPSAEVFSRQLFRADCIRWDAWQQYKSNSFFCVLVAGEVLLRYPSYYLAELVINHTWEIELFWDEFGSNKTEIEMNLARDYRDCARLLLADWNGPGNVRRAIRRWEKRSFKTFSQGPLYPILKPHGYARGLRLFDTMYKPAPWMRVMARWCYVRRRMRDYRKSVGNWLKGRFESRPATSAGRTQVS